MKTPFLSIIIPVYNASDTLGDTLHSVYQQDYYDYEILLIDDGSTDSSLAICAQEARDHPGFVRCIHTENKGVSHARNVGIAASRGSWIGFLDSDDRFKQDALSIFAHEAASVCQDCDVVIYSIEKSGISSRSGRFVKKGYLVSRDNAEELCCAILGYSNSEGPFRNVGLLGCVGGSFYRRSFIESKNLIFDERFSMMEDMHFKLKAAFESRKTYVSDQLVYEYIVREGSATKSYSAPKESGLVDLLGEITGCLHSKKVTRIEPLLIAYANVVVEITQQRLGYKRPVDFKEIRTLYSTEPLADAMNFLFSYPSLLWRLLPIQRVILLYFVRFQCFRVAYFATAINKGIKGR